METNQLYQLKNENFQKAINRQEGAYVPNTMMNNGAGFFWSGKSVFEVAGNHAAYADALTSFLDEMWVDVSFLSGLTTTPRRDQAFPTAENRLAENGTLTHLQQPTMKADEYDQLAADPKGFIANVLLPRKYPYLYENRETAKAALKVYAEEQVDNFIMQMGATKKVLQDKYGVISCLGGGNLNTPLDHIFDYFRGFRGTLTDLRRHGDQVKTAMEAIWEYQNGALMAKPFNAAKGFCFQPCHIPAYLSPKQYRELYWPYEKKLIEWVAAGGGKIYLIMEGRWESIMDCFLEVPKDSLILHVDDDDFLKVHEKLGHHQILCGGIKLADTRLKKFDDIKDDVKRLIDTCAPGGGFLLNTDKNFLTPGDINPTVMECYNFAHEYSSK